MTDELQAGITRLQKKWDMRMKIFQYSEGIQT